MPASTLSGRSVALLRVNLGNYTSQGRSISHGNCTRTLFLWSRESNPGFGSVRKLIKNSAKKLSPLRWKQLRSMI